MTAFSCQPHEFLLSPILRITILGTGALACLFGARLARHAEVVLLGTWQAGIAALNDEGIRIETQASESRFVVRATNQVQLAGNADFVLVLVKSWQTQRAAQQAAQVLQEGGLALTLQNGLGNYEKLAELLSAARLAMGVTTQGAALLGPGHIRFAGGGDTYLGYNEQTVSEVKILASLFNQADIPTKLTDDLEAALWGKLVANAGINPLTALLRVPNGELLNRPDAEALMVAAAEETASVAAAQGVTISFEAAERVREVARVTAENRSSMLQDVLRGAPTEIDAISGAVVRAGKRLGVATPVNDVLWKLIRAFRADVKQV